MAKTNHLSNLHPLARFAIGIVVFLEVIHPFTTFVGLRTAGFDDPLFESRSVFDTGSPHVDWDAATMWIRSFAWYLIGSARNALVVANVLTLNFLWRMHRAGALRPGFVQSLMRRIR